MYRSQAAAGVVSPHALLARCPRCNPMDQTQPLITLDTSLKPCSPFYFGEGIAGLFPAFLKAHDFDRVFLIAGAGILKMFGQQIVAELRRGQTRCDTVLINDSERSKDWTTLSGLCEDLVSAGVTKDSILLALGGGVIGNVVGLAAALIYRGIRFVQIPTTVTAQTDSTLSNKQAINGARGKNQFGVFHAPLFVWADAAYPRTEPPRQIKAGIVEGIKNVFISYKDPAAIDPMLRLHRDSDMPALLLALIRSKLSILRHDPTEKASAIALEYGHTFGHAIEWLAAGKLLHGEAVSIGMCLAAELSRAMGFISNQFLEDHYRYLGAELGTPTALPEWLAPQDVYDAMLADNKRTAKGLRFLLLRSCGHFVNPDGDYQVAADPRLVIDVLERSRHRAREMTVAP